MAAIDKIYAHHYYEYDELRLWAIIYYPKLLCYFYDITLNSALVDAWQEDYVATTKRIYEKDFQKLGDFKSFDEAVQNLKKHYKESADYDCPNDQANWETQLIIDNHSLTDEDIEEQYSFPVANCPFEIDKKLKWICPLPFVREYLQNQCGVNPKWEWFYKLFWKGKKEFL